MASGTCVTLCVMASTRQHSAQPSGSIGLAELANPVVLKRAVDHAYDATGEYGDPDISIAVEAAFVVLRVVCLEGLR